MVYCIGLTGDIASGKSTVAHLFSQLGIKVIYADLISKELTKSNKPAFKKIVAHYGSNILQQKNELDRKKLREIIFSNKEERIWLENLLHPLIREELQKQVQASNTPYCVVEIPLLIKKEFYPYINRILLVRAPLELQISRVMKRDQCNKEQALAILSTQPNQELRVNDADDIIDNQSELILLKNSLSKLHQKYLIEAKNI